VTVTDIASSFCIVQQAQWRINHEAMEARAFGTQFLGQKNRPRIPTQFKYLRSLGLHALLDIVI